MRERVRWWWRGRRRLSRGAGYRSGDSCSFGRFFSFVQRHGAHRLGIVLLFSLRLFCLLFCFESFLFVVFAAFFVFLLGQLEIDEGEEWLGVESVVSRAEVRILGDGLAVRRSQLFHVPWSWRDCYE